MKAIFAAFVAAVLGLVAAPSAAQVEVKSAWSRATVSAQKTAGAYMQLKSAQAASLVDAESPAAAAVEVHEMRMDGNVMTMRRVRKLDLPAGKVVELKPGGIHLMLIDLKQPLKKGESVSLRLKIEGKDKKVSTVEVKAEVRDKAP
ncbi:MAG: copper chaperone PCu(A)C [Betaproteobacteria bacterium]|nr:copper chaperone PCu(A)C [Betaproteobacteria bacterium]